MCEAVYIYSTQQKFKKRVDSHFSDLLRLYKNGQKLYSFAAHFEQYFDATISHTDLRNYMAFNVVKQLNPIG